MDRKILKEILAAHADQLVNGQLTDEEYLHLFSDTDDELGPLFNVAEQLKSTLHPIHPADEFETELKRQLLTTAHLRQVEGYEPPRPFRDLFVSIAISLAVLVSAAMLRYVIKRRKLGLS